MTWSKRFDVPIEAGGEQLMSLRDAATYITGLPAEISSQDHWQLAIKLLISAAERGGIVMLAHIATLKAVHHGRPAPARPPRHKAAKKYRLIR